MIYLDSNIPMYLIGQDHPNKNLTIVNLERLVQEKKRLVSSVEVFQEILHRYTAINRKSAIQPTFDLLNKITDDIYDINKRHVEIAKELILAYKNLSARDAIHLAIMKQHGIKTIFSFDKGFDQVPEISRIPL